VPWGEFFRHPPLYGTILAHFCYNYMSFLGLSLGPYFFQTKYNVDISNPSSGIGVFACLPYVVLFITQAVAGYTADWLSNSGKLSMTRVRKLFNTCGLLTAAIFFGLLATPMVQEGPTDQHGLMVAVALLTCAIGVGGIAIAGSWANYYDLSSKYSPHLLAIGTSLSTIPGMVTNLVSGSILDKIAQDPSKVGEAWSLVFSITSGVSLLGVIAFECLANAHEVDFDAKAAARRYHRR